MKLADINKTERLVKKSAEARWLLQFVVGFVSIVVIISPMLVLSLSNSVALRYMFCCLLIIVLMFMPNILKRNRILQKIESYEFYEGFVDSDNGRARSLSLHIIAKDENEGELSLNTEAIYDKRTRYGPCPYDYYKRRVLVGYNKVTNICVIIRTFRENETLEECIERAGN